MTQATCSVEACDKPARTRGWCSAHYERWRRNGDPGPAGDGRKRPPIPCLADGCDKRGNRGAGYCGNHYQLFRRHGAPVRVRKEYDGRRIHINGYVTIFCPDHPCAGKTGYAYEHRKVWYDAHGPIPDGVHVHHKNGDKTDNRLANLVLLSASEHARQHVAENGYIVNQFGTWPLREKSP